MIIELAQLFILFIINAIFLIFTFGLVLSIGAMIWIYKLAKLEGSNND